MKLSGALPKSDDDYMRNGLAPRASDVVKYPDERRIAIVVLSTSKLIDDRDRHSVEPVMAIDRIELVRPQDAAAAERILLAALEERSQPNTLPIFVRDDVKEAFEEGATQRSTGEIHLDSTHPLFDAPEQGTASTEDEGTES